MNIAVVTNLSKAHGGEARGLAELFPMYDFKDCAKINADLVIVLSGGQEQEAMRKYLPILKCKIAWWMCDFRHPSHFQNIPKVDYLFLPYLNYHKEYECLSNNGVYYLPQNGYEWKEKAVVSKDIDAIFIGNTNPNKYHLNRLPILQEIARHCNLQVISRGETTKEQSSIYKQVPLSISISSDEIIGGCSNRLYNITKAGGCAFVKYFEGLENLYTNHENIIWFNNISEIEDLLKYYFANREEIKTIKRNAKKHSNKNHSIQSRINKIINIVNG